MLSTYSSSWSWNFCDSTTCSWFWRANFIITAVCWPIFLIYTTRHYRRNWCHFSYHRLLLLHIAIISSGNSPYHDRYSNIFTTLNTMLPTHLISMRNWWDCCPWKRRNIMMLRMKMRWNRSYWLWSWTKLRMHVAINVLV